MKLFVLIATIAVPASASAQSGRERPPESHDLRRDGGDVVEVREASAVIHPNHRSRPYAAPYRGWRYRAMRPGDRLRPGFYRARYTIVDPARYGLAPARGDRRWIRYGEDLLLVNVRTGQVVRAIPNGYR